MLNKGIHRWMDDVEMRSTPLQNIIHKPSDRWIIAGIFVVFSVVSMAMAWLWSYKTTPGLQANAPQRWPRTSHIVRQDDVPTLIMFAHPMCPCTQASLGELRVLMSEFHGRVRAYVLFAIPAGVNNAWVTSSAWTTASSIPGVLVEPDFNEYEENIFAAKTSGAVVMYSDEGDLLFQGGITGARGHEGDNKGLRSLVNLLRQGSNDQAQTPVFGCSLHASH